MGAGDGYGIDVMMITKSSPPLPRPKGGEVRGLRKIFDMTGSGFKTPTANVSSPPHPSPLPQGATLCTHLSRILPFQGGAGFGACK